MDLPKRLIEVDILSEDKKVTLKDLSIDFRVTKTLSSAPSEGVLRVRNLSQSTAKFVKTSGQEIIIRAGYTNSFGVVYGGDLRKATNKRRTSSSVSALMLVRDGVDFVTELDIGGHVKKLTSAFFQRSYAGVVPAKTIVLDALNVIGINALNLSAFPDISVEDFSWCGRTVDMIDSMATRAGIAWFEDNGLAVFHAPGESFSVAPVFLSERTGMIGTPEITSKGIEVKSMLNPALRLGGLIDVESVDNAEANGKWKISKLTIEGSNRGQTHATTVEGRKLRE